MPKQIGDTLRASEKVPVIISCPQCGSARAVRSIGTTQHERNGINKFICWNCYVEFEVHLTPVNIKSIDGLKIRKGVRLNSGIERLRLRKEKNTMSSRTSQRKLEKRSRRLLTHSKT